MSEHNCVLRPLTGMEWDGQLVAFGDSRARVEEVLGAPERVLGEVSYYFKSELRVEFDGDGGVKFIECMGGIDGSFQPVIYDVAAFQTDAQELLAMLSERNGPDINDGEAEYAYALRTLSVGLYREITPADVDGMVKEMSRMDVTTLGHVNLDAEYRRANHWDTIGIGAKDYYAF